MRFIPIINALLLTSLLAGLGCHTKKEKALSSQQIDSLSQEIVYLVKQNHLAMVQFIEENIAKGANPNAIDTGGTPALIHASHAVQSVRLQLVNALVEHGADVNITDKQGQSALHSFCFYGDSACIDYFLSKNCDVTLADSSGYTPLLILTMSASAFNKQMGQIGSEKHSKLFWDYPSARVSSEDYVLPFIEKLLQRGADPLRETNDGESAYSIAKNYNLNMIQQAIEEHLRNEKIQ